MPRTRSPIRTSPTMRPWWRRPVTASRSWAATRCAFKITTPADLERARSLVARHPLAPSMAHLENPMPIPRVGVGTDVHAFGGTGTLWLAGLEWPGEPALSGHSDGDAVAHAIVDALLSAAGLADIGTHFGTDHPEYAGAHADAFLSRTLGCSAKRAGASAMWPCRCRRTVRDSARVAPRPRQCSRRRWAVRRCLSLRRRPTASGSPGAVRASPPSRWRSSSPPERAQSVRVMNTENGSSVYPSNGPHRVKPSLS